MVVTARGQETRQAVLHLNTHAHIDMILLYDDTINTVLLYVRLLLLLWCQCYAGTTTVNICTKVVSILGCCKCPPVEREIERSSRSAVHCCSSVCRTCSHPDRDRLPRRSEAARARIQKLLRIGCVVLSHDDAVVSIVFMIAGCTIITTVVVVFI